MQMPWMKQKDADNKRIRGGGGQISFIISRQFYFIEK